MIASKVYKWIRNVGLGFVDFIFYIIRINYTVSSYIIPRLIVA